MLTGCFRRRFSTQGTRQKSTQHRLKRNILGLIAADDWPSRGFETIVLQFVIRVVELYLSYTERSNR